jgi:hypothetical protein
MFESRLRDEIIAARALATNMPMILSEGGWKDKPLKLASRRASLLAALEGVGSLLPLGGFLTMACRQWQKAPDTVRLPMSRDAA